jgi:glycolate oxidase FAD binding subunit
MSTLEGLATALESVVGSAHLLTNAAVVEYAIEGVFPAMVVLPTDEVQIVEVLRLASEYQATVFPRGGGSHTFMGQTPSRVDLVLSLQHLQRQLAYEPADLTTTVQAGMHFCELQRTLGGHGQFLALDPPVTATTTLGGVVATNVSGPRRLLYGTARDVLLGVAVMSIDGKRTKAGGRVVKNVTGYDLNKLYIGSLGTLVIIVELTCKLHPLPPGELTLGIGCAGQADLAPMLQTILQLPLRLNSLELLNLPCETLATHADLALVETGYMLIARVEGTPAVTQSQAQRLTEALRHLPLTRPASVHTWSAVEQERLWSTLGELTRGASGPDAAPDCMVVKVSLLMSALPAFCQDVQETAVHVDTPWSLVAHAGSGIAYVCIPVPNPEVPEVERLLASLRALEGCVARCQGRRRVVERAPVAVKQQCQVWGPPSDDFALMRAIKASFDPQHRLNPGRFLEDYNW